MARKKSPRSSRRSRRPADGDDVRRFVVDVAAERIAEKAARQTDRLKATSTRGTAAFDRLASRLDAVELWTREEPGRRRPRFSRDEIAETALRIADAEGFDAVSMRRIAAELDAGTMTLYHYVRTKDELLALVIDVVMGELAIPAEEPMPSGWRDAVATIARRTRDVLRRHPWILDISDDPAIGPNSVRHFDQSMQAVASLDIDVGAKLDIITAVDEYVFGYCLHERRALDNAATAAGDEMAAYVAELIAGGEYPELARLIDLEGYGPLWTRITAHSHDPKRFERTLARLLDGIERDLS